MRIVCLVACKYYTGWLIQNEHQIYGYRQQRATPTTFQLLIIFWTSHANSSHESFASFELRVNWRQKRIPPRVSVSLQQLRYVIRTAGMCASCVNLICYQLTPRETGITGKFAGCNIPAKSRTFSLAETSEMKCGSVQDKQGKQGRLLPQSALGDVLVRLERSSRKS